MSEKLEETEHPSDFIRELIRSDNEQGTYGNRVQTRFPPEPNGYLHIGHAKSICLNFGVASDFGGTCNLRFDDTNPEKESADFVIAIERDLQWLGFESDRGTLYASDYFEQLYTWAEDLITKGLAYVDDQDAEAISDSRGDFTTPGTNSPFRDRSIDENLDLFRRMRAGEFGDGERVLRAKIDMTHANMSMRDPLMYRIRHVTHHRTGDDWCIYPNYDWAHGQSDAFEGVTHSFCTLEFENNRELYDWFLDQLELPHDRPRQTEFGRLGLTHIITSKRKLAALVASGKVEGWDDAQMSTLSGLRRRGYPAKAIREFCDHISVGRVNGATEVELLESFVRTELNKVALRRMAVLDPLKLVITNWPTDANGNPVIEMREVINNPEDDTAGTRQVPFSGELWIERDDFMIDPPKKFFRLAPGREVRLRSGYFVTCTDALTDADGTVTEVHVTYDPETAGGSAPDGRKVKATMHWVAAATAVQAEVRLYDRLFVSPQPSAGGADPLDDLNPDSMQVVAAAQLEPELAETPLGEVVQFERIGYFAHDLDRAMIFHRTVGLRDEWARIQKRNG
ncbi:glutamine--tRNA ligase/YqeY domain fusion protein [Acidimicrobiales bacterium]|nr:glutamine--tRNA ligase/YqeY domain fusion protein [Acidimicrobiales bacterium]